MCNNHKKSSLIDTTYQVTFKTGDRPNAGTSAKVQFELFGDQGKTEPIQLSEDRSLRLFERGNSDKFKVDTRDVGKVSLLPFNYPFNSQHTMKSSGPYFRI